MKLRQTVIDRRIAEADREEKELRRLLEELLDADSQWSSNTWVRNFLTDMEDKVTLTGQSSATKEKIRELHTKYCK